jgi:hypothetical protein
MKICVSYPVDVCYVQPCFSATWETVNPFDKSVFTSFANSGIFGKWFNKSAFSGIANDGIFAKWSDKVLCGTRNLFAILSYVIFGVFILDRSEE